MLAVVVRSPPVKLIVAAVVDDLSKVIPKPEVGVMPILPPVVAIVPVPPLGPVMVKPVLPVPESMLIIEAPCALIPDPELSVMLLLLNRIDPPP